MAVGMIMHAWRTARQSAVRGTAERTLYKHARALTLSTEAMARVPCELVLRLRLLGGCPLELPVPLPPPPLSVPSKVVLAVAAGEASGMAWRAGAAARLRQAQALPPPPPAPALLPTPSSRRRLWWPIEWG